MKRTTIRTALAITAICVATCAASAEDGNVGRITTATNATTATFPSPEAYDPECWLSAPMSPGTTSGEWAYAFYGGSAEADGGVVEIKITTDPLREERPSSNTLTNLVLVFRAPLHDRMCEWSVSLKDVEIIEETRYDRSK